MVGAAETLCKENLFPAGWREATPSFLSQLLAQQPPLPQLPLLPRHGQPGPVHSQSLLFP